MRRLLDASRLAGSCFQPENITIPKPRTTKGELQDCLETAAYASKAEDTLVFYFSGHSMGEHGLKLLIDAPYDDARRRWAASDVVRILNDSPAGSVIMILDSCEAGQAARELAKAHEELFLLTATDGKSRAKEIEQLGAGVFTYCLHDALTRRELRTIGERGLLDENANLGATKLAKWLEKEVPRCGRRHGKEVPEPKLYGPHDRDFYFAVGLEPFSDRQAAALAATGYPPERDDIERVNAALYLRRPLLITGRPGTGKTTLVYAVAREFGLGPVLRWSITSRSTRPDGLYQYDAVRRRCAAAGHPSAFKRICGLVRAPGWRAP